MLYAGVAHVTMRMAYHATWSAASRADYVSAVGEATVGPLVVLAGATMTADGRPQSGAAPADFVDGSLTESFVGASIPIGRARLIGSVEVAPQPSARLIRVVTTLKLPLTATRSQTAQVSR